MLGIYVSSGKVRLFLTRRENNTPCHKKTLLPPITYKFFSNPVAKYSQTRMLTFNFKPFLKFFDHTVFNPPNLTIYPGITGSVCLLPPTGLKEKQDIDFCIFLHLT